MTSHIKFINHKTISGIILFLFLIIGTLLIAIGSFLSIPSGQIVISIGAAIFGAIIGTLVTGLSGLDNISTLGILTEALSPGLSSDELSTARFRKEYHFYHQTEKNKYKIWRYSKIDLSKYYPLDRIKGKMFEKKLNNKTVRELDVIAGSWGDRFVILMDAKDKEPRQIAVFPFMGRTYLEVQSGFCLFESWDQKQIISPCILSETRLFPSEKFGTLHNKYNDKLFNEWRNQFSNIKVNL